MSIDVQGEIESDSPPENQEPNADEGVTKKSDQEQDDSQKKGKEPDENEEDDKETKSIPYQRFKEVNDEKKTLREENEALKKQLEETGKEKPKDEKKEDQPKKAQGTGRFAEIIGEDHDFKAPGEYGSIKDLYHDFREAVFSDFFKLTDIANTNRSKAQQQINKDLDEVTGTFKENEQEKNQFMDFALDEYKNGNQTPIKDLFRIWRKANPAKQTEETDENDEQKQKQKILAKGSSSKSGVPTRKYDPKRDRGKSMDDLMNEMF